VKSSVAANVSKLCRCRYGSECYGCSSRPLTRTNYHASIPQDRTHVAELHLNLTIAIHLHGRYPEPAELIQRVCDHPAHIIALCKHERDMKAQHFLPLMCLTPGLIGGYRCLKMNSWKPRGSQLALEHQKHFRLNWMPQPRTHEHFEMKSAVSGHSCPMP